MLETVVVLEAIVVRALVCVFAAVVMLEAISVLECTCLQAPRQVPPTRLPWYSPPALRLLTAAATRA